MLAAYFISGILIVVETFGRFPFVHIVAVKALLLLEHLAMHILVAGQALRPQTEKGCLLELHFFLEDAWIFDVLRLMTISAFDFGMAALELIARQVMLELFL